MLLIEYIVVKDLIAKQIQLKDNSVETLCRYNDYVIEKYRRETGSKNYDFQYKIYRNNEEQTSIKVGRWRIENLRSFSSWNPSKILLFDLVDPSGISSADCKLPYSWINSDNTTYIYVNWTSEVGINNMLALAKEASIHTYWLAFIRTRFELNVTEKYKNKINVLEQEVNELKSKLGSIQSLLGS